MLSMGFPLEVHPQGDKISNNLIVFIFDGLEYKGFSS